MCKFKPIILFYKGVYKKGIIVSISIEFDNIYYDSLYYYDENCMVITVPDELEINLGCSISNDNDYFELISDINNLIQPYNQIIDSLLILDEI